MSIDLDRITHPMRLAKGSHKLGSGKGCAMNAISFINGDTEITDFPDCSALPLARLVQTLNDRLADADGFLSPENGVLVLDLGWLTVGTAGVADGVVWRWLSELLIDPTHGVVQHATPDGAAAIRRAAQLCAFKADGVYISATEWRAAKSAAAVAVAADADAAADAAADADAAVDAAVAAAVAVAAYAAAAAAAYADAHVSFTRWAITRWREIAGLDGPRDLDADAINHALAQINH
jgi:hypothetical protein